MRSVCGSVIATPTVGNGSQGKRDSMSDYYRSLEVPAKDRYLHKVRLLGLDEDGDLYAAHNEEKFIDDLSLWPLSSTDISSVTLSTAPVCTPSISCYSGKAWRSTTTS